MTAEEREKLALAIQAEADRIDWRSSYGEERIRADSTVDALYRASQIVRECPVSSPWISVEERLPDPHVKVLGLFRDGPKIASTSAAKPGHAWFLYDLEAWDTGVTHWMPLPEPPK